MEKHKAHYSLEEIKAAFADTDALQNITLSARAGARTAKFTDEDIVSVVQSLRARDLYKSMTTYKDHTIWHDVYCPIYCNQKLYVKFSRSKETKAYWLVSFKRNDQQG